MSTAKIFNSQRYGVCVCACVRVCVRVCGGMSMANRYPGGTSASADQVCNCGSVKILQALFFLDPFIPSYMHFTLPPLHPFANASMHTTATRRRLIQTHGGKANVYLIRLYAKNFSSKHIGACC